MTSASGEKEPHALFLHGRIHLKIHLKSSVSADHIATLREAHHPLLKTATHVVVYPRPFAGLLPTALLQGIHPSGCLEEKHDAPYFPGIDEHLPMKEMVLLGVIVYHMGKSLSHVLGGVAYLAIAIMHLPEQTDRRVSLKVAEEILQALAQGNELIDVYEGHPSVAEILQEGIVGTTLAEVVVRYGHLAQMDARVIPRDVEMGAAPIVLIEIDGIEPQGKVVVQPLPEVLMLVFDDGADDVHLTSAAALPPWRRAPPALRGLPSPLPTPAPCVR